MTTSHWFVPRSITWTCARSADGQWILSTAVSTLALVLVSAGGGKPSRGTSKDKRLKDNKPTKPKSTKVTPRKGGMTRAD